MSEISSGTGRKKKGRIRIHETTHENDIRYIGPLTAQHFKILGWICIVLAQVAIIMRLGGRLNEQFAAESAGWLSLLTNISNLSLPFLLIAVFAQLLNNDDGYRKTVLNYTAAMVGVSGLFYLVFYRYIVDSVATFLVDPSEALPGISPLLAVIAPYGFFSFNLFVDLFLCTVTMFFLNYTPRRVFTGKARIFFRLMALLPIAYEVGCMLLKVRSARGVTEIPVWAWPLLTVKPPMTFVLFVALVLFVKIRERRFRRHGKTLEEYQEFLKTRRNSWNFSVFLAIMMVVVSLIDFVVMAGFSVSEFTTSIVTRVRLNVIMALEERGQEVPEDLDARIGAGIEKHGVTTPAPVSTEAPPTETPSPEQELQAALEELKLALESAQPTPEVTVPPEPIDVDDAIQEALDQFYQEDGLISSVTSGIRIAEAVGFGESISLLFLVPLVLLFSYTRRSKNRMMNMLIPAAGITMSVIVYVEGLHQLLPLLPVEKVDLREMREMVMYYLSTVL